MRSSIFTFFFRKLSVLFFAATLQSHAQIFRILVRFNGLTAFDPRASLVQGTDGNLYGTAWGAGTVFQITPAGALTTLANITSVAPLALGNDGNFYGTGLPPGTMGIIFQITPAGVVTTLHSFNGPDGSDPEARLLQATDGNFYGTTNYGGANQLGTVFRITPAGEFTTLHSFSGTDGSHPLAGLVEATNGNLYGTTSRDGLRAGCCGTVFKISLDGVLSTLHMFNRTDGAFPNTELVQSTKGDLYGTTDTTVFKITPGKGELSTLWVSSSPSTLIEATDGNFYGTTGFFSGRWGCGTIFKLDPVGMVRVTTMHDFECIPPEGGDPAPNALFQATDGDFYGTTEGELGSHNQGTVYRLSSGLSPFVVTLPNYGEVGSAITILGTELAGATSVTFNEAAAAFTVVSASEITATVPVGANTGQVQVTTPGGTFSSNVAFRVRP